MFRKEISRKDLLSACDTPGAGDGSDPRLDRRDGGAVPNRKALQLCAQAARALASAFAECGDDVLRDLIIESVVPAPNTSRLLVAVATSAVKASLVAEHLERAHGKLRTEVAAAINRRRAPDLMFRVVDLSEPVA